MRPAIIALSLLALAGSMPAQAGGGGMGGFATETTQWANFGEMFVQTEESIRQTIIQAEIIAEAIQHTEMMARNLMRITPQNLLTEAMGNLFRDSNMIQTFTRLRDLYQNGQRVAYTLSSLDERFRQLYPDWDPARQYNHAQMYADLSGTLNAHLRNAAAVVGAQAENFASEENMIQTLQDASSNASGALGALQAGNNIAVALVGQMQQMRQLQMAQMQATNAHVGKQDQNHGAERQALEKFFKQPRGSLRYEEL